MDNTYYGFRYLDMNDEELANFYSGLYEFPRNV